VVIGSPGDDDKGSASGSAYTFKKSVSGWQQLSKLTADDGAADDLFGKSVAISGETVVVGRPYDDDKGSKSGSAYIFEKSETTGWQQLPKLTADDGAAYDYFGDSVAISGETVVIGSPGDDDKGSESGSAYIFAKSGTVWLPGQKLNAIDGAAADYFGDRRSSIPTTSFITAPRWSATWRAPSRAGVVSTG
jgi:hypothetical protein